MIFSTKKCFQTRSRILSYLTVKQNRGDASFGQELSLRCYIHSHHHPSSRLQNKLEERHINFSKIKMQKNNSFWRENLMFPKLNQFHKKLNRKISNVNVTHISPSAFHFPCAASFETWLDTPPTIWDPPNSQNNLWSRISKDQNVIQNTASHTGPSGPTAWVRFGHKLIVSNAMLRDKILQLMRKVSHFLNN